MNKKHIGSSLDDFLREEDLLEVAEVAATQRVNAFQVAQELERGALADPGTCPEEAKSD